MDLRDGYVHVWLTFLRDAENHTVLQAYRRLLSDDERRQHRRFRFAHDQHRYLVTRALVRTVLSRYHAEVAPEDWRFNRDHYGRPQLAASPEIHDPAIFSITHTGGLTAIALMRGQALGLDAEYVREHRAPLLLAARFFAPVEVSQLSRLPRAQQSNRFYEYWTLKEAYVKARGRGLSIPLNQFAFDIGSFNDMHLTLARTLGDSEARWQCWQFRPSPNHIAALCAVTSAGEKTKLILYRGVPLKGFEPIDPQMVRASTGLQASSTSGSKDWSSIARDDALR